MRIIVCDAGPIIHLHEANSLPLLKNLGEIYLPFSVSIEVKSNIDIEKNWPDWLQVVQLTPTEKKSVEIWTKVGDLHEGEAEAFILSKIKNADWLLTDDAAARAFAIMFGIEVHGSIGILLWNMIHRYISKEKALTILTDLKNSSLWLSEKVFKEAQKAIIEINSKN